MSILFCRRCLYHSAHPLGLIIDAQGICSGCRVHEEKDVINWQDREKELIELTSSFKNNNGKNYDCLIPVSGGKDSYFIVDYVKNKLKLNPLLVSYNKQFNSTTGIRNLAYLRTYLNCDFVSKTIDPEKVKKITRTTLKEFGSIYWHCLAGETAFPVQMAVKMRIPLIIWGAHQGLDQVGMYSHLDSPEMTRRYRKNHDLMGYEAEDLLKIDSALNKDDVSGFNYPDENEISSVGVRGIYLGNYVRWDSKAQHEKMIHKYGYQTAEQPRTFETYNNVDCVHYSSLHDYIKLVKHGYSKVVDHANREIRLRRIDRFEAIELVNKHLGRMEIKDFEVFSNWVCISKAEIVSAIEKFAHAYFWTRADSGDLKYQFDFSSLKKESETALEVDQNLNKEFVVNSGLKPAEESYTLIGKGFGLKNEFYKNI